MTIDWRRAQTRLTERGLSPGPIDGDWGPKTCGGLLRVVSAARADVSPIALACVEHFPRFGMTTAPRIAEFIAQIANETGGFVRFEENLNYSAQGLANTWARYSTTGKRGGPPIAKALQLARKPETIANDTYANRMGNGPPASGDGWRYRGRGALQLTGRDNYRAAGWRLGLPLEAKPELAAEPATSVLIALDFWERGKVNAPIDRGDFREARRITNGGAIGLEEVARLRGRLLAVLV